MKMGPEGQQTMNAPIDDTSTPIDSLLADVHQQLPAATSHVLPPAVMTQQHGMMQGASGNLNMMGWVAKLARNILTYAFVQGTPKVGGRKIPTN
jgi:hypothetical protein